MTAETTETEVWALSTATGLGYDTMDDVRRLGWRPVPSWGRDGWDLGDWPYVVIYHRDADTFGLGYYVEGDITRTEYPTRAERDAATDELALWHWRQNDESWVAGLDDPEVMARREGRGIPAHLCGPYLRERHA